MRRGKICHASVQVGVVLRFAESHRSAVENLQGPGKTSCLFPEQERERFVTYYLCHLLCSLKGEVACSGCAWVSCCIMLWHNGSMHYMMGLLFSICFF